MPLYYHPTPAPVEYDFELTFSGEVPPEFTNFGTQFTGSVRDDSRTIYFTGTAVVVLVTGKESAFNRNARTHVLLKHYPRVS